MELLHGTFRAILSLARVIVDSFLTVNAPFFRIPVVPQRLPIVKYMIGILIDRVAITARVVVISRLKTGSRQVEGIIGDFITEVTVIHLVQNVIDTESAVLIQTSQDRLTLFRAGRQCQTINGPVVAEHQLLLGMDILTIHAKLDLRRLILMTRHHNGHGIRIPVRSRCEIHIDAVCSLTGSVVAGIGIQIIVSQRGQRLGFRKHLAAVRAILAVGITAFRAGGCYRLDRLGTMSLDVQNEHVIIHLEGGLIPREGVPQKIQEAFNLDITLKVEVYENIKITRGIFCDIDHIVLTIRVGMHITVRILQCDLYRIAASFRGEQTQDLTSVCQCLYIIATNRQLTYELSQVNVSILHLSVEFTAGPLFTGICMVVDLFNAQGEERNLQSEVKINRDPQNLDDPTDLHVEAHFIV